MTDQSSQGAGSQAGGGTTGAQGTGGMSIEAIDKATPRHADNPHTRGHSPARDAREAAAVRQAGDQQQPGDQPGDQQQQQAGAKIKVGDVELTDIELKDLMRFKGEQDARKLTLPATADAYELKLPEDFKLPSGVANFEFNKNDPTIARARELAHARGLDQQTFSDFLSVYAAERVAEATKIETARQNQIRLLGAMGPNRIDAVKTWAHGILGSELGGAIEGMLVTAKHVEAFEKFMGRMANQGGAQFSQSHRQNEPPAGTIPGYDNMTFAQKRAAQMNQNSRT
jgi:hypothetical protein